MDGSTGIAVQSKGKTGFLSAKSDMRELHVRKAVIFARQVWFAGAARAVTGGPVAMWLGSFTGCLI